MDCLPSVHLSKGAMPRSIVRNDDFSAIRW